MTQRYTQVALGIEDDGQWIETAEAVRRLNVLTDLVDRLSEINETLLSELCEKDGRVAELELEVALADVVKCRHDSNSMDRIFRSHENALDAMIEYAEIYAAVKTARVAELEAALERSHNE